MRTSSIAPSISAAPLTAATSFDASIRPLIASAAALAAASSSCLPFASRTRGPLALHAVTSENATGAAVRATPARFAWCRQSSGREQWERERERESCRQCRAFVSRFDTHLLGGVVRRLARLRDGVEQRTRRAKRLVGCGQCAHTYTQ